MFNKTVSKDNDKGKNIIKIVGKEDILISQNIKWNILKLFLRK